MNRREFSRIMLGGSVSAMLSPALLAQQPPTSNSVSSEATDLYKRALVLDCNLGPPVDGTLPLSQANLDMVRNSGVHVIKWSLGGINESFVDTAQEIAYAQRIIEV